MRQHSLPLIETSIGPCLPSLPVPELPACGSYSYRAWPRLQQRRGMIAIFTTRGCLRNVEIGKDPQMVQRLPRIAFTASAPAQTPEKYGIYSCRAAPNEARYNSSICRTSSAFSSANSLSCARLESCPLFWRRKPNRLLRVRSGMSIMFAMPARN
jgi:hypothetical protein